MFPAELSKANGDPEFTTPGLRALHQEDGQYTCAAPENNFDYWGRFTKKKKKVGKATLRPLPEPEAEVIKAVEIDNERRAYPEPSVMEPDDTTEVSRDAWGFWGVPKERRSPRVSFGS
jgi:hypothetical protein